MKAFVLNYNRLTLTRRMVDYLANFDELDLFIVDNNSTYEPLMEYYAETPHSVIHLPENYGSWVMWSSGILDGLVPEGELYLVTDPDLDMEGVPDDWLGELKEGLKHGFGKCGIGLRIDDLPDTEIGRQAREWETPHWAHPVENGRFYKASTLSTLCVCQVRELTLPSVRTNTPYLARHTPWYYTSLKEVPEDELYYMQSVEPEKWNYWTVRLREELA
jgi:hypothetical protein